MNYEMLIRFLLAALWGGIVGAEREYHSKSAGFRTMIMISIGACFFTIMSTMIGASNNPDRIASNIVTGIGFLGAGVIFRGENRVNGITTAATIWVVAAVGMGIGAGYYFATGSACVIVIIVLSLLPYCEELIDKANQTKTYTISSDYSADRKKVLQALFSQYHLKYKLIKEVKEGNALSFCWQVSGKAKSHGLLIEAMTKDCSISRFEY